jgi:uncharacterized pyridoxamine 5'-phosphate oxidase family protein
MADTNRQVEAMNTPTVYEIRVQGHIGASWSSWFEGLSMRHEENGDTVLHGRIADQAALHGVLNRIRDLGLPLVSVKHIENNGSGDENMGKSHPSRRQIVETRDQVIEFIQERKFGYLATLGTDGTPRVRPLAAHTVYGDAVYLFTFQTTRKVAEIAAHPRAELVWTRLEDNAQVRMRGSIAPEQDAKVQARFRTDNPMVARMLPPGAEHLFALYKLTPEVVEAVVGLKPYAKVAW